ncbi:MAG TPA: hypothetical protein VHE81_06400 [Lacipirellulaceae bacterium]|nr:hypothetical protein [Lacipirellulaceae bacterium]
MTPDRRILFWWLLWLLSPAIAIAAPPPAVYPLAAGDHASKRFTLVANGVAVPVLAYTSRYDYAHFSADGALTITIAVPESVRSWHISPQAEQIRARAGGQHLTFRLPHAAYVIVKINALKELAIAIDPLERAVPPPSGVGIYNITAAPYSADATGRTLATRVVQRAIDDAHAAGGGIVYVPRGTFLSAGLELRSNVSLYLAGGATLRSSGDPALFKVRYYKQSLKMRGTWFLWTQPNSRNIRIFGRGTIDGNARELRGRNRCVNDLVVPLHTSHFTIDGVVLRDSGLWGLIPVRSDHIVIHNTKHFNEANRFFEDDAVDIIESQDVLVSRSFAISEDDTYSTKTWNEQTDMAGNWPGRPEPLENVTFEDCLAWSRCATFKVGFGCFQPQRKIVFRRCCVYRCMRAIAINHYWGNASVENVTFDHIDVEGFQPRQRDRDKCRWLDVNTASEGSIRNTILENITVRALGYEASRIEGHDTKGMIDGMRFENVIVSDKLATSLKDLDVDVTNQFVTGIVFVGQAGASAPALRN